METVELPVYRSGEIIAHARMDDLDFAWARHFRWSLSENGYVSRHVRNPDLGMVYLHKIIAECAGGIVEEVVDHEDGDKLNCTRDNLRPTNQAGNMENVRTSIGRSCFRGVAWQAGKWTAKVRTQHLGRFEDELIAAQVAALARRETMPFAMPDAELTAALAERDWSYDAWPSGEPYDWQGASRGGNVYDAMDPHLDLGAGTIKKGRIGIDRYWAPGVDVVMDLDLRPGEQLPFKDGEIESVISHHCLEHIGDGFIPLIDEVYRVLKPGGIFRAITPLFPSTSAVGDADHRRYFMETTWLAFCGHLGDENNPTGSWLDSFSVPYTKARFEMLHQDVTPLTPPHLQWTDQDAREIRVALRAVK